MEGIDDDLHGLTGGYDEDDDDDDDEDLIRNLTATIIEEAEEQISFKARSASNIKEKNVHKKEQIPYNRVISSEDEKGNGGGTSVESDGQQEKFTINSKNSLFVCNEEDLLQNEQIVPSIVVENNETNNNMNNQQHQQFQHQHQNHQSNVNNTKHIKSNSNKLISNNSGNNNNKLTERKLIDKKTTVVEDIVNKNTTTMASAPLLKTKIISDKKNEDSIVVISNITSADINNSIASENSDSIYDIADQNEGELNVSDKDESKTFTTEYEQQQNAITPISVEISQNNNNNNNDVVMIDLLRVRTRANNIRLGGPSQDSMATKINSQKTKSADIIATPISISNSGNQPKLTTPISKTLSLPPSAVIILQQTAAGIPTNTKSEALNNNNNSNGRQKVDTTLPESSVKNPEDKKNEHISATDNAGTDSSSSIQINIKRKRSDIVDTAGGSKEIDTKRTRGSIGTAMECEFIGKKPLVDTTSVTAIIALPTTVIPAVVSGEITGKKREESSDSDEPLIVVAGKIRNAKTATVVDNISTTTTTTTIIDSNNEHMSTDDDCDNSTGTQREKDNDKNDDKEREKETKNYRSVTQSNSKFLNYLLQ